MLDVFLDSLLDSLKVLGVAFVLYILISFIEDKLAHILGKKNHFSPLIGSALGLIPQCGFSVVAANLYVAHHITMGTLIGLFLSCSDEALPILISSMSKDQIVAVAIIIGIKFVIGFVVGYIIDLLLYRKKEEVEEHIHDEEHCDHDFEHQEFDACCHHHLGSTNTDSKLYKHLLHPIIHSLKIFIYCFIINMVFGTIIYFVGEETIIEFLSHFKYISPIISSLIGIIPNCASSVLITETYLSGALSLGACISGLCMNAGLGMVFIFKRRHALKENLTILGIMFGVSILVGYIISLIIGF